MTGDVQGERSSASSGISDSAGAAVLQSQVNSSTQSRLSHWNHIPNNARTTHVVLRQIPTLLVKAVHLCMECSLNRDILDIRNTKPNKHFNEIVTYWLTTGENVVSKSKD